MRCTAGALCCRRAADSAGEEVERAAARLTEPVAVPADETRRVEALTGRIVAYLAR